MPNFTITAIQQNNKPQINNVPIPWAVPVDGGSDPVAVF